MRSAARLAVSAGPGGQGHRIDELHGVAPTAFRPTAGAVHLVGTAASPVGDDDTLVEIAVGAGADLEVRSVAATVAWRGTGSRARTHVTVAAGGTLRWCPQAVVATSGCVHRSAAVVDLADDATVVWWERLVLGRHGEGPGSLATSLHVDVGGTPLLRHTLTVGAGAPGWHGPAVLADHRCTGLLLVAGTHPGAGAPSASGPGWAAMPLEGPGALVVAVADTMPALDRALARAATHVGVASGAGVS
jgi:urease accessory protein